MLVIAPLLLVIAPLLLVILLVIVTGMKYYYFTFNCGAKYYLNVFLYISLMGSTKRFRTKLTDSLAVLEEIFNYTGMLLDPVMTRTSL